MSDLRAMAKRAAEFVLGSDLLARSVIARRGGARLVLAYHNVTAEEDPLRSGDRSLHLPLAGFRSQLDALDRIGLKVRPLSEPVKADDPAPAVSITFDDAYAGALLHALPELARRGLPVTVFVTPGLLGASAPWWDLLADPIEHAVPAGIRDRVLSTYRGEGREALAAAANEGWTLQEAVPQHRIASEAELRTAVRSHPGLSLGNHTWSHPNLAALVATDEDRAKDELRRTSVWLTERFGERAIPYLAYPYGLESPLAQRAAREVGITHALRVSGGWDTGREPALALPRLNVTPGLSPHGFLSRVTLPIR